jgi:hypothetical protein
VETRRIVSDHLSVYFTTIIYAHICASLFMLIRSLFKLASLHVIERLDMHGPTYLNTKYLSQVCVHEVSWLSDISSASLRVMNPYPLWPLSLPSCLRPTYSLSRTDIILPQVYDYIKRKQLFFYSQTYLRSMIRSRLVLLGMAGFGLLNWLLHDRRRGLK